MIVSPEWSFTCGCSRCAIRRSADSGSPWLPVVSIDEPLVGEALDLLRRHEQALGHLRVAELPGDVEVLAHRAADHRDAPVERDGGVDHLLEAVHVGRERRHAPRDPRSARRPPSAPDRRSPPTARCRGGRRWSSRRTAAALRRGPARPGARRPSAGRRPASGRTCSRPVTIMRAELARQRDGAGVGDRVRDVDQLEVERPGLDVIAGIELLDRHVLELVLLDLRARHRDRQRGAVDRAATPAARSRRIHGRAPTWSSWPCVSTIASMSSARSRRYVKSGRTRSIPSCSVRREHQPGVDHDDALVVLDDGHVLADLAQPAERQDAQGAAHAGTGRSDSTIRRTCASSDSSTSTSGSRTPPTSKPSRSRAALTVVGAGGDEERPVDVLGARGRSPASARCRRPARPRSSSFICSPTRCERHGDASGAADLGERAQQVVVAGVEGEPGVFDDPPRLLHVRVGLLDADDVVDPSPARPAGRAPG